ncbi:MAG: MMPL family transporter [Bacteroidetes bacterium]|nr:MMPL family transporter [Bacteroidota bacterium]
MLPLIESRGYRPRAVPLLTDLLVVLLSSVRRHPARYGMVAVVITVVSTIGISNIEVDTYTLGYLPSDNRVTRDHRFLEENWGDYSSVDVTIRPIGDYGFSDPKIMASLVAFSEEVVSIEGVSGTLGLHTFVKGYSAARYGNDRVLTNSSQIRSALRMVEALEEEEFNRLMSEDRTTSRMTLTGSMMSARALKKTLLQIEELTKKHFEGLADARVAGYPPLYTRMITYIKEAQVQSFYLAIVLVFLLFWLFIRDFKLALIAMVPNLIPVALMIGVMGIARIPLDMGTAMVAAIVLGVAIDDTIHLLVRYQELTASLSPDDALTKTVAHVGRSIVFTSIVLAFGFSILMLAGVKTVFYFGLLTSIAVVGALFGDLVLLPLVLTVMHRTKGLCQQ